MTNPRIKQEIEQLQSEGNFQALLESAPDAIVIVNHDGRIIFVNAQAEVLFGFRKEELLGELVEILVPERVQALHNAHRAKYATTPRTRPMGGELDLIARRKDGSQFPAEISLSPLKIMNARLVISAIRNITPRIKAIEEIKRKNTALSELHDQLEAHHMKEQTALLRLSERLLSTLDISKIIRHTVEMAMDTLEADASGLMLPDSSFQYLNTFESIGWGDMEKCTDRRIVIGEETAAGYAFAKLIPVQVADMTKETRFRIPAELLEGGLRSALSVPMMAGEQVIGALQINRGTPGPFSDHDVRLLGLIANQGAIAIEKAQLFQNLGESYDRTLDALVAALDARDKETEGHSRRVVAYTLALADSMNIPKEQIEIIQRGALLHDIGKIGVPDAILHKPGPLNDEEWSFMRRHPERGEHIIGGIQFLEGPAKIVVAHHERWDGTGYPQGLSGEDIPLGARIFAVADTFDAITSDRPYRAAQPYKIARTEIEAGNGSQFDPGVVAAFQKVPEAEWMAMRNQALKA